LKKGGARKVDVKCKIDVDLLMRILKQAGITKEEWLKNNTSHFTPYALLLTPYTSRLTLHTSRLTLYASHLTLYTSHFTLHASRFTPYASRFTPHTLMP